MSYRNKITGRTAFAAIQWTGDNETDVFEFLTFNSRKSALVRHADYAHVVSKPAGMVFLPLEDPGDDGEIAWLSDWILYLGGQAFASVSRLEWERDWEEVPDAGATA